MSIISVNNLSFAYKGGADYIFKDVSFTLDSDWRLGFVGRNGRGKTTFLRLLMGQMEYSGNITSRINFDYFPFEIADKTQSTLDILSGMLPDLELWRLQKELNLLNVDGDRLYIPFNLLSGGEQSKILLAALFVKQNNFLLIDEPTNHLDAEARQAVASYLSAKKSFILVSHDRSFLDGAVDHILSINRANIEVNKGDFSTWLINKERQDNFEIAQNEKLKGEIDRLKTAAKRKSDWSDKTEKEKIGNGPCDRGFIGHKAAKVMKTAKVIERRQNTAIDEKGKLLKNIDLAYQLKLTPLKHHSNRLVEMRNLSVFYGENKIFEDLNLTIEQGERVAVVGKNGCGKTSLIRLFLEKANTSENTGLKASGFFSQNLSVNGKPNLVQNFKNLRQNGMNHSGIVTLASNIKISYVSQDTSFLCGNLRDFAEENKLDETLFKAILAKMDFSSSQFDKDISEFSEGQKKKVLLAKSLSESAHLYIWDEPLNYVDILSRIQIEKLLKAYAPTMLFVEHDAAFTASIATKTLKM